MKEGGKTEKTVSQNIVNISAKNLNVVNVSKSKIMANVHLQQRKSCFKTFKKLFQVNSFLSGNINDY